MHPYDSSLRHSRPLDLRLATDAVLRKPSSFWFQDDAVIARLLDDQWVVADLASGSLRWCSRDDAKARLLDGAAHQDEAMAGEPGSCLVVVEGRLGPVVTDKVRSIELLLARLRHLCYATPDEADASVLAAAGFNYRYGPRGTPGPSGYRELIMAHLAKGGAMTEEELFSPLGGRDGNKQRVLRDLVAAALVKRVDRGRFAFYMLPGHKLSRRDVLRGTKQAVSDYLRANPTASDAEAARSLDVDRTTVRDHRCDLMGKGKRPRKTHQPEESS